MAECEGAEPKTTIEMWVGEWRRLNSEDEHEVQLAKENVRRHMTLLVNRNAKERNQLNRVGTENGLADDVAGDL